VTDVGGSGGVGNRGDAYGAPVDVCGMVTEIVAFAGKLHTFRNKSLMEIKRLFNLCMSACIVSVLCMILVIFLCCRTCINRIYILGQKPNSSTAIDKRATGPNDLTIRASWDAP
jgi:hypothetical protein